MNGKIKMNELELERKLKFTSEYKIGDVITINSNLLKSEWYTSFNKFIMKYSTWKVVVTYIGDYGFSCKLVNNDEDLYNDREFSISYSSLSHMK